MKNLILLITALFLFSLGLKAQATEKKDNPSTAEITFEALEHDYGTINKDANGDCEFIYTNTGKEPLIITECKGSCGCTVPKWTTEPVLPGQKGTIKVHYATNRVGQFEKTVTVTSNAKNSPVVLHIKGNVLDVPPTTTTPAEEKK